MVTCVLVYGHGSHHIPLCRVARCFMNGPTESRQIIHKCNRLARGSSAQRGVLCRCRPLFISFSASSSLSLIKMIQQTITTWQLKKEKPHLRLLSSSATIHYLFILLIRAPYFEHCKSPTENKRIKITWCSSIPSHTKPLLLSWIVSSTLMTIQYSLQAADERPIHSSICCGPNSPDASLVRGPLQANWKTEAISQTQCLCAYVCVLGGRLDIKKSERERKEEGGEIIDKGWREWRRGSEEEKRRHSSPRWKNSWPVSICSHAAILEKPLWALN